MIEPTTAMAEMALVSDISGVCSSRETLRITSSPVNVASMNTYNSVRKSAFGASASAGGRRRPARSVNQATWFDLSFLRRVRETHHVVLHRVASGAFHAP